MAFLCDEIFKGTLTKTKTKTMTKTKTKTKTKHMSWWLRGGR